MAAVAIIPARGGSRRIPRKNIRHFHGKPIIAYSIEAAKASGLFDRIYVSSDDREIGYIADYWGAQFLLREEQYAHDDVGTQEVMRSVLDKLHPVPDYACCIYPCAPMLKVEDLLLLKCCVEGERRLTWAYIEGMAYYGATRSFLDSVPLTENAGAFLPENRWIDINTEEDWMRAESMYAALNWTRVP